MKLLNRLLKLIKLIRKWKNRIICLMVRSQWVHYGKYQRNMERTRRLYRINHYTHFQRIKKRRRRRSRNRGLRWRCKHNCWTINMKTTFQATGRMLRYLDRVRDLKKQIIERPRASQPLSGMLNTRHSRCAQIHRWRRGAWSRRRRQVNSCGNTLKIMVIDLTK